MLEERTMTADHEWPTGAVTFLFSDIENSTPLWDRHQSAMQPALAKHDALLRTAVQSHGGIVVKNTGDGLLAAFISPANALSAAVTAQRALYDAAWPTIAPDRIRVRMGLHTGEAELREGDYYGSAVNRAARLMSIGYGGQVLVSSTTIRLIEEALPAEINLLDLGEHQLRGLARPAHVFQVQVPGLPGSFPPLKSAMSNLPAALTPFIGRKAEMAAMAAQFEEEACHLLTLHGPGGSGKTRLALEFARHNSRQYAQGVCFVPLAGLVSPANLAPTIAAALGLSLSPQPEPRQQLLRFLQTRQLLLLLDNFEHLREGADLLVDILQAAPQVRILVTSRERLQLAAENLFMVPGLRTAPEAGESAAESEAVQMFVAFARRACPEYRLDGVDRPAVTGICSLVEGMPLAIELAAAWVRAISPAVILEQIAAGCRLLETAGADVPPRLRSVRASFNYSWGLLDQEEQQALSCLSVCRGGCTGAAATACAAATPQILAALVDKSMLAYDRIHDRYTFHELVRQLAEERLEEGGQAAAVYRRHAGHFCALARGAWDQLERDQRYEVYYQVIGPELDNCRTAQERSLAADEAEAALQLAVALSEYLADHGMAEEALRSLEEALAAGGERYAPATRAAAYLRAANLRSNYHGGRDKPIEFAQKGLALYRELADQDGVARSLYACGLAFFAYDFDRSRDYITRSIEAFERAGSEPLRSLGLLSGLEILAGNLEAAHALLARRRAICEKLGLKGGVAAADTDMAYIYYFQGRLEEAQALAEKSVETWRALGTDFYNVYGEIDVLTRISLKQRRLDRAQTLLLERLQMSVNDNYFLQAIFCLDEVAEWFYHSGHFHQAAFWIGGYDQAREWFVQPVEPVGLPHYEWLVATIREALGEEAYTAAWQKGFAVPVEDALPLALQALEQTPATPAGVSPYG